MSQTESRNRLMGYTSSSLESSVWEELTNMPAVSTVKIFQMAKQDTANTFTVFLHNANPPVSSDSIYAWLDASMGDDRRRAFADGIFSFVQQGYDVQAHKKEISLGDDSDWNKRWNGIAYRVYKSEDTYNPGEGFIIHGGIGNTLDAPGGGFGVWPAQEETPMPIGPAMLYTGDPVNTANGDVTHQETDFSLPNLGIRWA